jgi:hypothetical protein
MHLSWRFCDATRRAEITWCDNGRSVRRPPTTITATTPLYRPSIVSSSSPCVCMGRISARLLADLVTGARGVETRISLGSLRLLFLGGVLVLVTLDLEAQDSLESP